MPLRFRGGFEISPSRNYLVARFVPNRVARASPQRFKEARSVPGVCFAQASEAILIRILEIVG